MAEMIARVPGLAGFGWPPRIRREDLTPLGLIGGASIFVGLYVLVSSALAPILFWEFHKLVRFAFFAIWLVPPLLVAVWLGHRGFKLGGRLQQRLALGGLTLAALTWIDLKLEVVLGKPAHLFLPWPLPGVVEAAFWLVVGLCLLALAVAPGAFVLWAERQRAAP